MNNTVADDFLKQVSEVKKEAERLSHELIEEWGTGYDDSTCMRKLLYRYMEKAILVGRTWKNRLPASAE